MNLLSCDKAEVQRYSIFSNAGRLIYSGNGINLKEVFKQAVDKKWSMVNCHLEGEDLSGLDFSEIDLSFSYFKECDFRNCGFVKTYLNRAVFINCNFRGSSIIDSIYETADFRKCSI